MHFSFQMKKDITNRMQECGGDLRVPLATEAFGMGTDAPDVRHIIHVGPPMTTESKYQL